VHLGIDSRLVENALLRQQLIVAARSVKCPAFRSHERGLVVMLGFIATCAGGYC
jgi:hypothetical protein